MHKECKENAQKPHKTVNNTKKIEINLSGKQPHAAHTKANTSEMGRSWSTQTQVDNSH